MQLNRHGERAPDADELSLSDQQELIKNLTYIEGPEGLTNVSTLAQIKYHEDVFTS